MVRTEKKRPPGASPGRWGDLPLRVASALLLAPVALACLWFGGLPWTILLALAALGLAQEWSHLMGTRPVGAAGLALAATLLAATLLTTGGAALGGATLGGAALGGQAGLALGLLALGLAAVAALGRRGDLAAGVPYLGLALIALAWLRADADAGRANVLFVLLIVWASDIGAYCVGRLLGGPKLAPRISPAKTWSGAIGGLAAAMAVGALTAALTTTGDEGGAAPLRALPVAALLGIASQSGDLLESALKRHYGVKDSGHLIPGHGGLLDRLDGLIAAAPVAALLAALLGRGMVLWQ